MTFRPPWRNGRRSSAAMPRRAGHAGVAKPPVRTGVVGQAPLAANRRATGGAVGARTPAKAGPARGARWLLLLIVTLGSLHVLFMLGVEGLRLVRAELAISELEREVAVLEQEADGLQSVIEHGEDQRYREQLARRQGYMYPHETRVVTSEPR